MAPSTATSEFSKKYGPWALVTGASSGIGAQFARSLAARGLNVILTARRTQKLEELASELSSKHSVKTHVLSADLAQPGAGTKLATEVAAFDIGLLINNAGIESMGLYIGVPVQEVERLIAVNVTSVATIARLVGRQIAERGTSGGIIFTSSIGARPSPFAGLYASSKAFVSTLAISMKYEMADMGVDVLAIEPGLIRSEMTGRTGEVMDIESMGFDMMETEDAVEAFIRALGKKDVCTPGWKNRAAMAVLSCLPKSMALKMMAGQMKKLLPADKTSL